MLLCLGVVVYADKQGVPPVELKPRVVVLLLYLPDGLPLALVLLQLYHKVGPLRGEGDHDDVGVPLPSVHLLDDGVVRGGVLVRKYYCALWALLDAS